MSHRVPNGGGGWWVGDPKVSLIARFRGEDGSFGYRTGQVYVLELATPNDPRFARSPGVVDVVAPFPCPYQSWESFAREWERVW